MSYLRRSQFPIHESPLRPFSRARRWPLLFFAVLLGKTLSAQNSNQPLAAENSARREGWKFMVRIDASSVDEKGLAVVDSTVLGRAALHGPDGRLDILRSNDPEMPVGGWVVSSEGGRTMIAVDPAARRFAALKNASSARAMAESKLINLRVSGLVVKGDTLGPCGTVDGHPTTCYRLTREYKMTVRYFFIRRSAQVREELRFWVATDLAGMSNPVARFLADASAFTIDQPDVVMRARRLEENLFDGVALKLVMNETQTEIGPANPRAATSVVNVELSDVQRGIVDPTSFEVPSTYRLRK